MNKVIILTEILHLEEILRFIGFWKLHWIVQKLKPCMINLLVTDTKKPIIC